MPFILGDEVIKMILTKEEAKRRREKVLKVAFKLFVRDSIEAVSMQQIADASKVGVASVFRYYANKTDLVIAVSAYKWHESLKKIEKSRPIDYIKDIPAVDLLEFTLDTYLKMYNENKKLLRFNDNFNHYITREHVDEKRLKPFLEAVNPMLDRLHWMYQKGKEDHTIRTDIPEDEFIRATAHSMMVSCQHYAGGFIWGADEDKNHDYMPELELLKEMIMKFACDGVNQ